MTKNNTEFQIKLDIPNPIRIVGDTPIFEIGGTYKTIIHRAVPDPRFVETKSLNDMFVQTPKDSIVEAIRRAIAKGSSSETPTDTAQRTIDSFFSTNVLIRSVDPNKVYDQDSSATTIYLDFQPSTRWKDYELRDWKGVLDIITTPQGEKIGHSYKLASGVKIENQRFVKSKNLLSDLMRSCIVFPENNRPNRLLITRSAFTSHEELVYKEQPLVSHTSYKDALNGIHLITAILSDPENYQDCLVISKSAAAKLACIVRKNVVVQDTCAMKLLVKTGDKVCQNEKLVELSNGRTIRNLYSWSNQWEVEDISVSDILIGGNPAEKIKIRLSTIYECTDGCKLTNRHGGKGVVKVRDDSKMPKLNGKAVDILVHPMSFNSRRNLGTFREMMINKKFWNAYLSEGFRLSVDHFSKKFSMNELVEEGFGDPTTLDDGTEAFLGPLYWLRTQHHSQEAVSLVKDRVVINECGMKPDNSRISGKRMSMNYSTILEANGLREVSKALISKYMSKSVVDKVNAILKALR